MADAPDTVAAGSSSDGAEAEDDARLLKRKSSAWSSDEDTLLVSLVHTIAPDTGAGFPSGVPRPAHLHLCCIVFSLFTGPVTECGAATLEHPLLRVFEFSGDPGPASPAYNPLRWGCRPDDPK